MKYLWWLLPLANLWVCFWFGYMFIDSHPFENWWSYPFIITLLVSFVASLILAIKKIRG